MVDYGGGLVSISRGKNGLLEIARLVQIVNVDEVGAI